MRSFLLVPELSLRSLNSLPIYGSEGGCFLMFATLFDALILLVVPAPGS